MILLGVWVAALVVLLGWGLAFRGWGALWFFLIVSSFLGVGLFSHYSYNVDTKAGLISVYEVNSGVYQVAADRTASYLSAEGFGTMLLEGSIETVELASVISQRVAEWRDTVADYNERLTKYQIWQANPFIGFMWPQLPDNLKYLVIQ